MCGIVGYWGRAGDLDLVRRMCDTIVHRGPDDEGIHLGERVALGMRRLAIIDRAHGAQPISNEDGTITVVYNGEIYNHDELRERLKARGHQFRSRADTEVLVHGYEEWGEEGLLSRLNGMFAFAIHDARRDRLFLARDRLGIKPLYYTRQGGVLYFVSEVKALMPVDEVSFQPDEAVVPEYLALRYVPAPRTLFRGIHKIPAGHYMTVDAGGNDRIVRYWYPEAPNEKLRDDEYLQRFAELFEDAVRIRLMSEVPLGAYLSEGLDSNLVVWAMSRGLEKTVSTYSIGFGGKYDETAAARRSAEILGTNHNEIHFDETDFEDLAKVIWHLDEPIGDAHVLPSFILAREARKSLTVVLLGEGADESLYGYPFYKVSWLARALTRPFPAALTERVLPGLLEAMPLGLLNAVFPLPAELGEEGRRHLSSFLRAAPRGQGEHLFRLLSGGR